MQTKKNSAADHPAQRFLDTLGSRDFDALESIFAPNLWFRALLPRKLVEHPTAAETLETLKSWYGGAEAFRVLETDHHTLAGREYIRYRFLLQPDWAPDDWHVIEQVGFLRVKEGRISRLDIVCTGFFPAGEADVAITAP